MGQQGLTYLDETRQRWHGGVGKTRGKPKTKYQNGELEMLAGSRRRRVVRFSLSHVGGGDSIWFVAAGRH